MFARFQHAPLLAFIFTGSLMLTLCRVRRSKWERCVAATEANGNDRTVPAYRLYPYRCHLMRHNYYKSRLTASQLTILSQRQFTCRVLVLSAPLLPLPAVDVNPALFKVCLRSLSKRRFYRWVRDWTASIHHGNR